MHGSFAVRWLTFYWSFGWHPSRFCIVRLRVLDVLKEVEMTTILEIGLLGLYAEIAYLVD